MEAAEADLIRFLIFNYLRIATQEQVRLGLSTII